MKVRSQPAAAGRRRRHSRIGRVCGGVRSGITLIEILTVISIIALLAALLLPALSTAREKAREVQCITNLQQIGLLTVAYVDARGNLPPAGDVLASRVQGDERLTPRRLCGSPATPCDRQSWGWLYQIAQVSDGNTKLGLASDDECAVRAMQVPLFFCPSNGGPWHIVNSRFTPCRSGDGTSSRYDLGGNDYAGNWGTEYRTDGCHLIGNGPFARDGERPRTLDSIADGASTTILAGDKRVSLQSIRRGDQRQGQWGGWTTGANNLCYDPAARPSDTLRTVLQLEPNATDDAAVDDGFGSSHSGGANFLFCGFQVQKISYGIDRDVLQHLATANGGEYVDGADF